MSEPIELGPRTLRALMAASIKAGDFDTDAVAVERADELIGYLSQLEPDGDFRGCDSATIYRSMEEWRARAKTAEGALNRTNAELTSAFKERDEAYTEGQVQGYRSALNDKTNGKLDEILAEEFRKGHDAGREAEVESEGARLKDHLAELGSQITTADATIARLNHQIADQSEEWARDQNALAEAMVDLGKMGESISKACAKGAEQEMERIIAIVKTWHPCWMEQRDWETEIRERFKP